MSAPTVSRRRAHGAARAPLHSARLVPRPLAALHQAQPIDRTPPQPPAVASHPASRRSRLAAQVRRRSGRGASVPFGALAKVVRGWAERPFCKRSRSWCLRRSILSQES